VTQLCVEFHHRRREIGVSRTPEAISALRAGGYRIFHISHSGEEYSFLGPRTLAITSSKTPATMRRFEIREEISALF